MIAALTRYLGVTPKTLRIFLTISLSACIYWFLSIKTVTYEPFRAALGVTNTELGTLLGITGFVQVFGYITLGWLQDMLQIRGIIMIDLIVYALLALSLALLPTPPFWWLCVVFAGFGLFGEALYWPTVQKATRGMSGPTHQAALFSTQEALRGAMGFIANLVTLLLFVTFGSQVIGVRMAMICYPLVMVALAYVVFHNVPADFLQKTPEMHEVATKRPRTSPGIVLTTLRSPIVWTTGLAAFAGYTAYIAVTTYALVLFQSTFSINDTYIAALGMINTGILPVVAALLSGWIARRFRSSSQWMTVLFVAAATLSFAVIPLSGSDTPYAGLIATGFLALCCYAIRAVYFVPIGEYDIDDAHAATVMSVASFLGYLPSFLAYPIFGTIIDAASNGHSAQRTIFLVLGIVCIIGMLISVAGHLLIEQRRRQRPWPTLIPITMVKEEHS
ncbi:MFS transporter [Bifidobacterium pullorum subsp. saeculare]|uniref:MFS transporter n=1 Tax=Bifidobacterium pullorum TaxID=78448 RepID=UPI00195E5D08|nr:MFS transporter [Bifidobacterium pullorum]MBM6696727.1 MFS transporter [Bifidobacterium pullorum subsp. saeculare]